ncbi:alpha beta-hydrolase [Cantharellus anzutake]|uniref:alpha beta-hydrolase n=1 Tax=Cantharellus anzutake TaxID=1750568 RepID=UPI001906A303|nr:alpha beta-hydrolase [Cantharellus anzutake]KAF8342951.1 alpha beta-hydrolase [Cantharellus anzutake]
MTTAYTEAWVSGRDNTNFYTRAYSLPYGIKPVAHIVFIHGFIEHIGRYDAIFRRWQTKNVSVFGFDQRGWGRTALDKEHSSWNALYGLTTWEHQMEDIAFFINRERQAVGYGVPIFLMGQSMGGGEVLGFGSTNPKERTMEHQQALYELTGIIASAPIIRQTTPVPTWQLRLGTIVAKFVPWIPYKAPIHPQDLCHDPKVQEDFEKDPLVVGRGTVKGITDMLNHGIQLDTTDYKFWVTDFSILVLHGDEDKVTAWESSQKFVKNVSAKVKHHSLYHDGYHELHNEPEPVKTRFFEECWAWVQSHSSPTGKSPKSLA